MKTISFTGYCPQCALYNEEHLMRENNKNWECPNCNLQVLVENNGASVFRHRGNGIFKFNFNRFNGNISYQEVDAVSYPNGVPILNESHLIKYLLQQVNQHEKFSIDKLIETYVNFKFNEGSEDEYRAQSAALSIDFDNEGIVEDLKIRDAEKGLSIQFATARLYNFLTNNIFPKYHNADNSWLPEMGMSQIEMYLCRKHFPQAKIALINSDPSFIRQCLKELIVDLIEIIYNNKEVLLSYDLQELAKIKQQKFDTTLN